MTRFGSWIFYDSVEVFCENVARFVGYRWDSADADAFLGAIERTDVDRDVWFDYPVVGTPALELRFALNEGSGVVSIDVRGEFDAVLEARLDTLCGVLSGVVEPRGPMLRALDDQYHQHAIERSARARLTERSRSTLGLTVADDDDLLRYFGVIPEPAHDPEEPWIRAMTIFVSNHEEVVVSWDLVMASVQVRYVNRGRDVSSWVAEEANLLTGWANAWRQRGGRRVRV